MSSAKFYIYRNLNKGSFFSVKYKGKVIDYLELAKISNPEFTVSDAGRRRSLASKSRNVHAYIVCSSYEKLSRRACVKHMTRVSYNPFKFSNFYTIYNDNMISVKKADVCYLQEGKAYVKTLL